MQPVEADDPNLPRDCRVSFMRGLLVHCPLLSWYQAFPLHRPSGCTFSWLLPGLFQRRDSGRPPTRFNKQPPATPPQPLSLSPPSLTSAIASSLHGRVNCLPPAPESFQRLHVFALFYAAGCHRCVPVVKTRT